MRKVVVFGNSGSGKSTVAKRLSARRGLAHLDLDTLAWQPTSPPERAAIPESRNKIEAFMSANEGWVIEGCYADLLSIAIAESSEIVFMNLPVQLCTENARNRPWESHKYESKASQDANLEMLVDWIDQYPTRTDVFSQAAHQALYDAYTGAKIMHVANLNLEFEDRDSKNSELLP